MPIHSYKYCNSTIDTMIAAELQGNDFKSSYCSTKEGQVNASYFYLHQMQGKLAAINLLWVYFALWTTKDNKIIKIAKCMN